MKCMWRTRGFRWLGHDLSVYHEQSHDGVVARTAWSCRNCDYGRPEWAVKHGVL